MDKENIEKILRNIDEILKLSFEQSKKGDLIFSKINELAHECKKCLGRL